MSPVKILNVLIDNLSSRELLDQLRNGGVVFTPNVDHLIKLQKDVYFQHVYNSADYRICDSQILMYVSKFLGKPIQEKISGSDLFPRFYQYYKTDPTMRIFLLGGSNKIIASQAQNNINTAVGRQMVVGVYSPPFGFEKSEAETQKIIDLVEKSGATVLAVGVGAPKQEKWIYEHKDQLKTIQVFLAIGATIDFEAGYRSRAPQWMSEIGLEWLYRLLGEPQRLAKRYLVEDLPFFQLVALQKLNRYSDKLPIGQVLQQAGLLSEYQVGVILQAQSEGRNLRFGELLALRGWLKPETIDFFAEDFPRLTQEPKQPLGQYLKTAALLTDEQISLILQEQGAMGLRFGEMAVLKGWVKQETIDLLISSLISEPYAKLSKTHPLSTPVVETSPNSLSCA